MQGKKLPSGPHSRLRLTDAMGMFALAVGTTYFYAATVLISNRPLALALHNQIVSGGAPSPYSFRLLAPWTIEILRRGNALVGVSADRAFLLAEAEWSVLAIWCTLTAASWSLARVWGRLGVVAGALLVVFSMNMALRDHFYQPWSLVEPAMFVLGYEAVKQDRLSVLTFVVIGATFNRETACFLVLLYFLYWWPVGRTRVLKTAVPGFAWLCVFLGVRVIVGAKPFVNDWWGVFGANLQPGGILHSIVAWTMFLGPCWYFFVRGVRLVDRQSRQALLCLIVFGVVFLAEGCWWETRPWMSFYCLLLPPVCASVQALLGRGLPSPTAETAAACLGHSELCH